MPDRVNESGFREAIGWSLDLIPAPLRALIGFDVFCGCDPVFAGLHSYLDASFNRSYRSIAHTCYPYHIAGPAHRRRITLVLPRRSEAEPSTIIHELGHVLDFHLGMQHESEPVSGYAKVDRGEAFAEAFTSWLIPGYARHPDAATTALLEMLSAGE